MVRDNESRFYQQLTNDAEQTKKNMITDSDELKKFWSGIWGKEMKHNREAEWLSDFRKKMYDISTQQKLEITKLTVRKMLRKIPIWKATDPDGVKEFWLKNFNSMPKTHNILLIVIKEILLHRRQKVEQC